MNINYISHPDIQLGRVLSEMLDKGIPVNRIIFVSAFVSLQTIMRMKKQVLAIKNDDTDVRFVIGIDLGGTSQEVLQELLNWKIDVWIVKHRIPGHTFHPKIYLFEWNDQASIIIGSNNLTEGGFYGNYECAVCITHGLPAEIAEYNRACEELKRFLKPESSITKKLTEEFLGKLIAKGEIPTEAEARKNRNIKSHNNNRSSQKSKSLFGIEYFEPPPPLPAEFLERLVKDVRARRRSVTKVKKDLDTTTTEATDMPIDDQIIDSVIPVAFYMTLSKLQGENIPGEGRVPLDAIELAKNFWGWPDEYSKEISPRAGQNRIYWNWRPKWKIWSVESPDEIDFREVRMYMYENSSDFRFYARPLVNAGGDIGDVVRIRRVSSPEAEYELVLAKKGTPEFSEWIKLCTQPVRNSTRSFGYA